MNAFRSSSNRNPLATRRTLRSISMVAILCLAAGAAFADVPGRVGRLDFMQGDVQSYSESEPEWKVAYVNEPITSHNSLFVGDGGRAEVTVGSTTLAMDGGSQVDIQQLDDNTFNANVVRGRVSVSIRHFDPNDAYSVAVPGADFALLQPGRYRVDALDSGSGITVFAGQASAQSGGNPVTIPAGNALRIVVNPQDPNGAPGLISGPLQSAPIDDWVVAREERFRQGQTQRYVSQDMTGYEDLDANGRWATEADVGPIWYPTTYLRADWAPYRYGRWAYVAPWGYTWIDDAPWGFAPFHYGRWIEVGGRWGWCPGAYVGRPAYAPALVGFYGGSGFSASFSVGVGPAVGWYPLAPWERFSPGYAHSAIYVNQVNNIAIVNAPPRFVSREGGWNREHGGTVVPQQAFASQRPISQVAVAAPRGAFERAAAVNPGELPRPAAVPGAVRRGPTIPNGIARPEFRPPREFAQSPAARESRPTEAVRGQPGGPEQARGVERTLPPNYQRLPEQQRSQGAAEAPRAPQINPGAGTTAERPMAPRGPNAPSAPNFSREGRPVQQSIAPPAVRNPNPPTPDVERVAPRQQAMQRGEGEAVERARQQAGERPREFRAPPPVQNVAPQVPQGGERQERGDRQRERQAPVAPVAPAAAQAQQPRPQAAPQPPHPPRAQPAERGGENEREPGRDR